MFFISFFVFVFESKHEHSYSITTFVILWAAEIWINRQVCCSQLRKPMNSRPVPSNLFDLETSTADTGPNIYKFCN